MRKLKKSCLIGLLPFVFLFLMAGETLAKEWPAETSIEPYKKWTIKFNSPVDPTTITSANVYVDGLTTTVSPGADNDSIIVNPPTGGYKPGWHMVPAYGARHLSC